MARNFRRQRRLYVVVYLLLVVPLYVSLALTLWLAHEHALVPHS